LRAVFAEWLGAAKAAGITADWFDLEGAADEIMREWGQRADFIVLKRPGRHDADAQRNAIHTALFDTDRPVLVVPPEHSPIDFGRCVGLLWRDDRRTIKAVLAALRCLGHAEHVHVLAGARQGDPVPGLPDVLSEHGIAAELDVLPIGQETFGQVLLARAHELGADLLVMGAFVQNRVRTVILGGVTRYMLAYADLPVLMRH
jgi:nucleotide-binding universal stress UspA family protein